MMGTPLFAVVATVASLLVAAPAFAQTAPAQTVWRLLDYIAVDYPEAISDGRIVNQAEYDEMKEFSSSARTRIEELPPSNGKASLQQQAASLERSIAIRAPATSIAMAARNLAAEVIKIYPVPLAPSGAPDVARGAALYTEHCASCHGATGNGDGPQARRLDPPPPIAFTDEARARERSVFALYQVIEQGLPDTSMASFVSMPPQDRWALAFYVGSLAFPQSRAQQGQAAWDSDAKLRQGFNLEKLVSITPAALAADIGSNRANNVMAYLRRHPDITATIQVSGALSLARSKLDEAMAAYERGDRKSATDLALSAYLDGFEPVEGMLSAKDSGLMVRIEGAMADLRTGIAASELAETVKGRINTLDGLFEKAETVLSSNETSGASAFIAAFTILVREGLEAILIVVAMIAFLSKANRRDALPYVHGGWAAAIVAGAATWAAATWLITISGASRELTEGFGGILAAFVLLWVGIWMHGKSNADAWQRYIREKLSHALNRRSAWFLFALAFVVVYREVFETILFYAAIWSQGNGSSVLMGALAAITVLSVIATLLMHYSRTLPIGKFFAYSSALIAILAIVLIGKGTAALQEAGYLPIVRWIGLPRNEFLGIFPTRETILAQAAMLALLTLGFFYNRAKARSRAV